MATSEAVPLAKFGGLAEPCGVLPVELARLGHRPAVILPAYQQVFQCGLPIEPTAIRLEIPIGNKTFTGRLLTSTLPGSDVPVYLVQHDYFFDRPGIYGDSRSDYRDNCQRFVFFCRAVLETVRLLDLDIDLLHVNDWPTSLIPALLDIEYRGRAGFESIASLLTIHNISYQGRFWHWDMLLTGLDWKYFNWHQMEFYGDLNLLKTGIVFADNVNTVSPRYAQEIQVPPGGGGLEDVLRQRRDDLSGIANGIDDEVWNPATDPRIVANYDHHHWKTGKAACKASLQATLGLPQVKDSPLIVLVGPLMQEKSAVLITQIIESWSETSNAQWALIGSDDSKYAGLFRKMARAHPRKLAVHWGLDEEMEHGLVAGADVILAPGCVEPCGVHPLRGQRYGAVPIVHCVGGRTDAVTAATPEHLEAEIANGFLFRDYTTSALNAALRQACDIYENRPEVWNQLVIAGMQQDCSWKGAAAKYVRLYHQTVARMKQTVCA